jgi:serine/threonine protein kinase/tetratricopeptide (TPR) repeat protein
MTNNDEKLESIYEEDTKNNEKLESIYEEDTKKYAHHIGENNLDSIIMDYDKNARIWYEEGNRCFKQKKYKKALQYYKKTLEVEPNYDSALNKIGMIYYVLKKYDHSIKFFKKAISLNNKYRYYYNLGKVYYELNDYREAVNCFKKVVKMKPDYEPAWNNLGTAYLGLNKFKNAIECFDMCLMINPYYEKARENKKIAKSLFNEYGAYKNDPIGNIQDSHITTTFHNTEDNESFNSNTSYINTIHPSTNTSYIIDTTNSRTIKGKTAKGWFIEGDKLRKKYKKYNEAIECYMLSLKLDPNNYKAYNNCGISYYHLGKYDKALEYIEKALNINPNSDAVKKNMKRIQNKLKNNIISEINTLTKSKKTETPIPTHITYKNKTSPEAHTTTTSEPYKKLIQYDWSNSFLLGEGGFAKVFKVRRNDNGMEVAVKIPSKLDDIAGKSFLNEFINWTRLKHPNIVKVHNDYNICPLPYVEMELCDCDLLQYVRNKNPSAEEVCQLMLDILEGLKYAHGMGIVHTDLKPQNILIKNDIPKISDWGLSKIINENERNDGNNTMVFTPIYAAPEQIRGEYRDYKTDIWQVCVIFYQLITGTFPFNNPYESLNDDPTPPSMLNSNLSEDLDEIILKGLSKNPKDRYKNVGELYKKLANYLKITLRTQLTESISVEDYSKSIIYCGELILSHLRLNEKVEAYNYIDNLIPCINGDIKNDLIKLKNELEYKIKENIDISNENIMQMRNIIHRIVYKKIG